MTSLLPRLLGVWLLGVLTVSAQAGDGLPLKPCRLKGLEHEVLCGRVRRPLDPSAAAGVLIDVHFAVLPALARNKKPDPVFVLAGGPGQSAIGLAGAMAGQMARFLNRRDVVLIDQRGTGRSAPLYCAADVPTSSLRDSVDPVAQQQRVTRCRSELQKLPHGDLRQYTTAIAVGDLDAVREALGFEQINLIGASYGTRTALEVLRQFPRAVRRVVIDGVAPPDMALPSSVSTDNQAAWDAGLLACEANVRCRSRFPQLREQWANLLQGLPRTVTVAHPVTGRDETLLLTHDMLLGLVRSPLYVPVLASALPYAVAEAASGRMNALLGLWAAMGGSGQGDSRLALGMHFSVVCAEDVPRMQTSIDAPGADFGTRFSDLYLKTCAHWPRGDVPPGFYRMGVTPAPVLALSGGMDPVTPPRHGERVVQALGAKARHVVVPHAGHGVMGVGCMRDVVFRFVDAPTDEAALALDTACAKTVPRPPVFEPPGATPSSVEVTR